MGDGLACSEERPKAIKGCVDKNGITRRRASGLRSQKPFLNPCTYPTSSLKTLRSLSRSPDASGSSLGGGIKG